MGTSFRMGFFNVVWLFNEVCSIRLTTRAVACPVIGFTLLISEQAITRRYIVCATSIYLWLHSPLLDLGRFLSSLILFTVARTPWTGHQPVSRPLPTHKTTQTQNKRTQTSMSCVGFEPTLPAFERPKTVHALDSADTVIGSLSHSTLLNKP
jgi:hypothetical protein